MDPDFLGAAEDVVGDGDDRASIHHDLAATHEPQWFRRARPVEGHGDRRPPVDDDRVAPTVFDVAAADMPNAAVLLVDAAEQKGTRAVGQQRHPPESAAT